MKFLKLFTTVISLLLIPILYSAEAHPQFFSFTLKNQTLNGKHYESAATPVVKTSLQGKTFVVNIETELSGKGSADEIKIPEKADKIKIFDCLFTLPPPDAEAWLITFPLVDIDPPWYSFEKSENQCALLLIYAEKDQRGIHAQLCYRGKSGREIWTQNHQYKLKFSPDGKIISRSAGSPFFVKDGKLYIHLSVTGKYYKYLKKADFEIKVPGNLLKTL